MEASGSASTPTQCESVSSTRGPVFKERVTLRQIEPQAVELFHATFGDRDVSRRRAGRKHSHSTAGSGGSDGSDSPWRDRPVPADKEEAGVDLRHCRRPWQIRAEILLLNCVDGRAALYAHDRFNRSAKQTREPIGVVSESAADS